MFNQLRTNFQEYRYFSQCEAQNYDRNLNEQVREIPISYDDHGYPSQFRLQARLTPFGNWLRDALGFAWNNSVNRLYHQWLQKHCKHKGTWVDESYGGPDSGGAGGHCSRCGFSFWHQYY